eukprot:m.74086 g.74086  ORF g.74086 m.74086 type:complete len:1280 (-) comp13926_c0_seq1:27-3866(-)
MSCWKAEAPVRSPRTVNATPFDPQLHLDAEKRESEFCDNRVITSKYTLLSFFPINLFEQFRRAANFYFLTMMLVAFIPDVAVIDPITSVLPLVFVIGVTAIKQAYEDYQRHRADAEINLQATRILDMSGDHHEIHYQDVRVGDIVKVLDGEEFPCDLVLLASSLPSHDCFITTANLDGEATLKIRYCPHVMTEETWQSLTTGHMSVQCSPPDPHLYEFEGTLRRRSPQDTEDRVESIGVKQMLLKGARLRNTEFIYGLCVYTGSDSKTALNQPKAGYKFSTVERRLNHFLAFYFVFLVILCTVSVVVHDGWSGKERRFWPLYKPSEDTESLTAKAEQNAKDWLSFMLLYNWVIPISLYVTMELQKLAGSLLIKWDIHMYDPETNEPALARTSDLMEDVGQINYVFADKTGTLTENEMVFKHCNIGATCLSVQGYYQHLTISAGQLPDPVQNDDDNRVQTFSAEPNAAESLEIISMSEKYGQRSARGSRRSFLSQVLDTSQPAPEEATNDHLEATAVQQPMAVPEVEIEGTLRSDVSTFLKTPVAYSFFECLAVCHTVTIEYEGQPLADGATERIRKLSAPSPDEEALVLAAEMREVGFKIEDRNEKRIKLIYHGTPVNFEILHVLEFNSKRKRMSVLVRNSKGEVKLMMKGADSAVLPRTTAVDPTATEEERSFYEDCERYLDQYSRKGLRTLVIASRTLSQAEAQRVITQLTEASETLDDRKGKLNAIYESIEKGMTLLGVTAVEDRLQDGVPETIVKIRQAGIAMWVLTGDKVQTAINISISAGHFTSDTPMLKAISVADADQCKQLLWEFYEKVTQRLNSSGHNTSSYGTLPTHHHRHHKPTSKGKAQVALILDDITLAVALKHHAALFRALSMRCMAVLCCRLSPAQKAAVVRLVKTGTVHMNDEMAVGAGINPVDSTSSPTSPRPPDSMTSQSSEDFEIVQDDIHPVTLAIGDGANDVAMIRQAHIGVGITGKEGRQAARTSDYSIARFRFLARLLLVHGHYSYWRMAYCVQYFFYKNLIYILPFIYFGPRSLFSAQTLYEQWLLTFWSVFFTSLPILCFGIFEKDLEDDVLLAHPKTYAVFTRNSVLTWKQFFIWTVIAIWHGTVAYYGMTLLLSSMRPELSLYWLGTAIYTLLIVIVTLKIATDTQNWTWIMHVCTWGSVLVYVAFVLYSQGIPLVFGSHTTPGIYWTVYQLWGTDYFWGTLVVLVVIALLPGYVYSFGKRILAPNYVQQLQAKQWADEYKHGCLSINQCKPEREAHADLHARARRKVHSQN